MTGPEGAGGPALGLDRRWLAAGAVALFALLYYADVELRVRRRPELAPAATRPGAMGYDEFMKTFGALREDPEARSFAQSFREQPALAAVWGEFQEHRSVPALVEDLKSAPEFRELLAQRGSRPGFRKLAERSLELLPGLSELLRSSASASIEEPGDDRMLVESLPRGASASSRGSAAGRLRKLARRGTAQGRPSPGMRAQRPESAGAARSAGGSPGRAPAGASATSIRDEAVSDNRLPPGPEAHRVDLKLPRIRDATSPPMELLLQRYPWLAALTEDQRRSLLPLIDPHGLWGACFALELYAACLSACEGAGGSCVPVAAWRACLDFTDDDAGACAALCPRQPGCMAPPRALAAGQEEENGSEWRTGPDGKEYKAGDFGFRDWEQFDRQGSDEKIPVDQKPPSP
ncbi:MAG: hypothetical protein HY553_22575 [Elusimicrobia bacterium]|nr:hypothetical protein [Elusimicrobiota bacterium]